MFRNGKLGLSQAIVCDRNEGTFASYADGVKSGCRSYGSQKSSISTFNATLKPKRE